MFPKSLVFCRNSGEIVIDKIGRIESDAIDVYRRTGWYKDAAVYSLTRYSHGRTDRSSQYLVIIENIHTRKTVALSCFVNDWEKRTKETLRNLKDISDYIVGSAGTRTITISGKCVWSYDPDIDEFS